MSDLLKIIIITVLMMILGMKMLHTGKQVIDNYINEQEKKINEAWSY